MLDKIKQFAKSLNPVQRVIDAAQDIETMSPLPALTFAMNWLQQQADLYEQPSRFQEALAAVEPMFLAKYDAAASELMAGALSRLRLQLFLQVVQPFAEAMSEAYLVCLRAYKPSMVQKPGDAYPPHAGALRWGTSRMLLEFIATRQTAQVSWLDLYRTLPAMKQGKLPAAAQGAVKLEFARFSLLASGLIAELDARQVEVLDRMVGILAPFVAIGPTPSGQVCYSVDITQDQPPQLLSDSSAAMPAETLIYADFDRVLTELNALEHFVVQQGSLPQKLNPDGVLSVTEVLVTLRQCRDKWRGKVHSRRHDRRKLERRVDIAYDFLAVRRKVSGAEAKGRLLNTGIDQAQMEDISQSGIGLIVGQTEWGKVGMMLGLRLEGSERWVVGVVRRLISRGPEAFLMGVEILALQPQSVRLVDEAKISVWERTSNVTAFDNVFAIWIPPSPHSGQQAMLLLENRNAVTIGKAYGLYYKGQKGMVRVKELTEVGTNFFRFHVDLVGEIVADKDENSAYDF